MACYYHCSSTSLGYFDFIVQCFLIVALLLLLLLVAHRLCVSFSILFFFYCNAVSNSSHTFKFPTVCSLAFVSLLVAFVFCFFFVVVVVALILLTCTVLRVAAADGARWKEQQAIVFFPLSVSKRPLCFATSFILPDVSVTSLGFVSIF